MVGAGLVALLAGRGVTDLTVLVLRVDSAMAALD
jgi:hypothetical protein